MQEYNLELKTGMHGLFKDGRLYRIKSISKIMVSLDGTMKWGDLEIEVEGSVYGTSTTVIMRISEFLENVRTFGNLVIF